MENSKDPHFATGNELDILINDHVDIKYVCMRAEQLFFFEENKKEIA